jgi:hypothetical protein
VGRSAAGAGGADGEACCFAWRSTRQGVCIAAVSRLTWRHMALPQPKGPVKELAAALDRRRRPVPGPFPLASRRPSVKSVPSYLRVGRSKPPIGYWTRQPSWRPRPGPRSPGSSSPRRARTPPRPRARTPARSGVLAASAGPGPAPVPPAGRALPRLPSHRCWSQWQHGHAIPASAAFRPGLSGFDTCDQTGREAVPARPFAGPGGQVAEGAAPADGDFLQRWPGLGELLVWGGTRGSFVSGPRRATAGARAALAAWALRAGSS